MTTNETYESLYARYRKAAGMTQEYAAELAIAPEGFLPPWIARAKSRTVFGPNDGRKVEDGDA